jgi:hypothetical protein
MLAVGGHCKCSPRTLKTLPTPLLSGVKMKETHLVLTMLVNRQVAAAIKILNIKYMKPAALKWDGTCLEIAEDVSSWMVAILLRCLSLTGQSLDQGKHNAGICPQEGLIDGNVEGQCDLSAKLGQQYRCTELEPWY